jgi:hypothetical protein
MKVFDESMMGLYQLSSLNYHRLLVDKPKIEIFAIEEEGIYDTLRLERI